MVPTVTWTVETTLEPPHATEETTTTVVDHTCMLTVKEMIKDQATSEYTTHATDTDMDIHVEESTTATTVTDTSETTDIHQAHHATTDLAFTLMITVMKVAITTVPTVTWTVETTLELLSATMLLMTTEVELTCTLTVKEMIKDQATSEYT